MKAAVLHRFGEIPRYEDFPDPIPGEGEVLVHVKAVVLENINKMMANGTHYSTQQFLPSFPAILGHAGIGALEDGRLVGFGGMKPPFGAMAEKVVVSEKAIVPIPEGVDAATAATLPSSAMTSYLPLKYVVNFQAGETIIINGATGVSGKLAIQVAKLMNAGRIIGTGRNKTSLAKLAALGADIVIDLTQEEAALAAAFSEAIPGTGNVTVIDYLWGQPAEQIMKTFIPKTLGFAKRKISYVQVGQKAGANITLPAETLRTSGMEILGLGNIPHSVLPEATQQIWKWIAENNLQIETENVPLSSIAEAWTRDELAGRRVVLVP